MATTAQRVPTQKTGWLWKKGALRKNWKWRYFVLHNSMLSYYAGEDTGSPLGSIALENAVVESDADKLTGYRFSFIIFGDSGRDYWLRGESESSAVEWLVAITAAIVRKRSGTEVKKKKKAKKTLALRRGNAPAPSNKCQDERQVPIFGVALAELLQRDGAEDDGIPYVMVKAFKYIRDKALLVQGIFRISGDAEDIRFLRKKFESGQEVDLDSSDPHTVAGLLKSFFRDLPEPLSTFELYPRFLAATQSAKDAQVAELRSLIDSQLPAANRRLMAALFRLLYDVSLHSDENSMTISNLAICFAPNLFRTSGESSIQSLKDAPLLLSVTRLLITNCKEIFGDVEAPKAPPPLPENFFEELVAPRSWTVCKKPTSALTSGEAGDLDTLLDEVAALLTKIKVERDDEYMAVVGRPLPDDVGVTLQAYPIDEERRRLLQRSIEAADSLLAELRA